MIQYPQAPKTCRGLGGYGPKSRVQLRLELELGGFESLGVDMSDEKLSLARFKASSSTCALVHVEFRLYVRRCVFAEVGGRTALPEIPLEHMGVE